MNLGARADLSYVGQRMKMWQLISKKCCPVFPFLMNQSGNSAMALWSNNKLCTECGRRALKGLLNKQCKAIASYVPLICKLAVAFLGHYGEEKKLHGANYFEQPSLQVQQIVCFFCFLFFFYIRSHSICGYLMEWTVESIERQC